MVSFSGSKDEEKSNGRKSIRWLWLAAAVGAILLLLGGMELSQDASEAPHTSYSIEEDEQVLYQQYLEKRVESLCASMSGVGKVTAVVTLSGGFTSEYATEWIDGNEEYVILGNGSSASALFLSRTAPTIEGIGIVCHQNCSESARAELIALVSAAFHVPSNRIYVTRL